MSKRTFASMFSGGGLADVGMIAAGWEPLWGIEFDADIAGVYCQNIDSCVMVADVRAVDYRGLERPEHLHASPVCKNASIANSDGKETEWDLECADAVCRALRALEPETFSLENVYPYRKFRSYQRICRTLSEMGYTMEQHHLNAASFGVPQTRQRLILRATQTGVLKPLQPTHRQRTEAQGMFAEYEPLPSWIGWLAAIEDILDTLPASRFADWQLRRMPAELFGSSLVEMRNISRDAQTIPAADPAWSICASDARRPSSMPHAYLVESRNGNQQYGDGLRPSHEPATSVCASSYGAHAGKAFLVSDQTGNNGVECGLRDAAGSAASVRAMSSGGTVPRAFLLDGKSANYDGGLQVCEGSRPAVTLTASQDRHPFRAFLMPLQGEHAEPREQAEPALTVTANHAAEKQRALLHDNGTRSAAGTAALPANTITGNSNQTGVRAWLEQGRVVAMTPQALMRFMSGPDWYQLPGNKKLACTVIGNGVCPLLMQRIAESLS